MKIYGLIGYPLIHSFSNKYFSEKFKKENIKNTQYKLFPISKIQFIKDLIKNNTNLFGLNVTAPFKESVLQYLDEIDPTAKQIAAVNTIKILRPKNKIYLTGYNTDAFAFKQSLKNIKKTHYNNALILGTGGASKSVAYVLKKMNINFIYVSRKPKNDKEISYTDLDSQLIRKYKLIINTTPLGMFPDINKYPDIPYKFLSSVNFLYDLIYNPAETLFLKLGKERGTKTQNGLKMLYTQAEKSWEIWNKK